MRSTRPCLVGDFINEIGCLCEADGSDAREVSAGLKSDVRIGPRAYLGAGVLCRGHTCARRGDALRHRSA